MAVVATVAVGVTVAANGLSRAGEIVTGTNVIRDKVMGGNDNLYTGFEIGLGIASMGAIAIGQMYSPYQNSPSTNKDIGRTGTPFSNITMDKGYTQTRLFDYKENASLDIDFYSGPGHYNPHFHIWDNGSRSNFINWGR